MRKIKSVLRLRYHCQFSRRAIAAAQKISYGTVDNYLRRAAAAGIDQWPLPPDVGERELGRLLFPSQPTDCCDGFSEPDFFAVQKGLKLVGMTKLLAWEEYRELHPDDGYSYSQFCHRFRTWLGRQKRSMRQIHIAGEKCFVDYCGPTVPIINEHTGEFRKAQVFGRCSVPPISLIMFLCATGLLTFRDCLNSSKSMRVAASIWSASYSIGSIPC